MEPHEIFRGLWKLRDRDLALTASLLVSHGIDIERYPEKAYAWCLAHAEAGEPEAQYALSKILWIGITGIRDDLAAVEWCKKSSKQRYLPAIVMLSGFYSSGIGVEEDHEIAIQLLESAVDSGSADAMFLLGTTYENGIGVNCNHLKALSLWHAAANLGHSEAQYFLGKSLTMDGNKDEIYLGVKWLEASAQQGFPSAHSALAHLYETGTAGLPKDKLKAANHRKKATDLEGD